jgi:hypothetical protein
MRLPSGKFALGYHWSVSWPPSDVGGPSWPPALDGVAHQNRIFCYVGQAILDDFRNGKGNGFSQELDPSAWDRGDATESCKQTQFDVADVQLAFHGRYAPAIMDENNRPVKCVKFEPDIDWYKDLAAHGPLEVIPNWIDKVVECPRERPDRSQGGARVAVDRRQARRPRRLQPAVHRESATGRLM